MKKLILASVLFIATGICAIAAPRIVLEDKSENYVQTESGYSLQFKLLASSEEFNAIMAEIQAHADRLTMNVSEGSDNSYDCILVINHQNQPEYVHKMLLAIGISDLEYKGTIRNLDAIIEILYSYL